MAFTGSIDYEATGETGRILFLLRQPGSGSLNNSDPPAFPAAVMA
jgi:hypothetical protein